MSRVLAAITLVTLILIFFSASEKTPLGPWDELRAAAPVVDASRHSSLQAAIDAVPATGGLVRIPPGEFEITEPLRVTGEDISIEGSGTSTHIKNNNQDGQPALIIEDAKNSELDTTENWRIRLANFRITGNEKSGSGIVARSINEIFIDGVTVSYHGGDGILLDHCREDPRICDCLITYNKGTGLNLLGCHDIVVSSNQFEENTDALRCFDGYNLCATGNCLDDHLGKGIVIENTYGSVVAGNMIEECKGPAIVLDRDCYGITLSANVIAHNGAGICVTPMAALFPPTRWSLTKRTRCGWAPTADASRSRGTAFRTALSAKTNRNAVQMTRSQPEWSSPAEPTWPSVATRCRG